MKGMLFSVIEETVIDRFGDDTWDAILTEAGLDGVFTSLGDYPDEMFNALVHGAAKTMGVSFNEALVFSGRHGFAILARRHPGLMADIGDWRSLLSLLDHIIHPEVNKIYAGASAPSFVVEPSTDGLQVLYRSKRNLCHLAEGLTIGGAAWFGAEVAVDHLSCIARGDDECRLNVRELT